MAGGHSILNPADVLERISRGDPHLGQDLIYTRVIRLGGHQLLPCNPYRPTCALGSSRLTTQGVAVNVAVSVDYTDPLCPFLLTGRSAHLDPGINLNEVLPSLRIHQKLHRPPMQVACTLQCPPTMALPAFMAHQLLPCTPQKPICAPGSGD